MMAINAAWNVVFFRTADFQLAFLTVIPYDLVAIALLITLIRVDQVAAWTFAPYMVYLAYANVWGYGVWQANRSVGG